MNKFKFALPVMGVGLFASSANAAVDVGALETALLADIATVSGYGYTLLAAVLAAGVGITLVRKFTNKAT